MDRSTILERQHKILQNLVSLPQKILSLHNHTNVTELILHALCHPEYLNFTKAAYFVDNPDFNCLKGVAGIHRQDHDAQWYDQHHHDEIEKKFQGSFFNQRVRSLERHSLRNSIQEELCMARDIAQELKLEDPQFCLWPMKHENHGLLIFEPCHAKEHCPQDYVNYGCALLGLCPIY
jgi:hypothetical protein